ncbi:MAG: cytochrome C [Gammaproteobacteria bacterium]|nr:cytochrome C [Gammaproteobacteria bacterium]MBU1475984.1 cytochrome C [Gammaproteobacteria bacterium]MBU2001268.1 cytochrome C [Gammaproteobacteria bacterium]MBU2133181.1 cytochrome C [Gammaproteobacteria bacterium]MBU2187303.1 cytochrome C [Gammaproteobacteria bacterium]
MKSHINQLIVCGLLFTGATFAAEYPVDPQSGLIMAPGWELVNYQCNACHTSMIVTQNRGDKAFWKETLQWMVDTQGLWDLSDTWEPTLSYLSTYYGQAEMDMTIFRRLPIESSQLPPPVKPAVKESQ